MFDTYPFTCFQGQNIWDCAEPLDKLLFVLVAAVFLGLLMWWASLMIPFQFRLSFLHERLPYRRVPDAFRFIYDGLKRCRCCFSKRPEGAPLLSRVGDQEQPVLGVRPPGSSARSPANPKKA